MGFFSKYNKIESQLLNVYSTMLAVNGLDRNSVENILDKAILDSKRKGTYNLPPDLGHTLLEKEKQSENVKANFEKKRKEGVRDNDIKWWYGLNDVERKMILKANEINLLALFMHEKNNGKNDEEADATVRKFHPIYGDLNDETRGKGDDRPLPLELKDRINVYIEKQGVGDQNFKKRIDESSSFNALVRKEILAGNI